MAMTTVLQRWNSLDQTAAEAVVLPCNGSRAWAERLALERPFATEVEVLAASDAVWVQLPLADMQEAFDSHPRLGEHEARTATEQSLALSATEQSGLDGNEALRAALAQANRAYEARFGRIFLLCASGKDTRAVLAALQRRLAHTPEAELREASEQQRRITQLRLRKWLGMPAVGCEDV